MQGAIGGAEALDSTIGGMFDIPEMDLDGQSVEMIAGPDEQHNSSNSVNDYYDIDSAIFS